MEEKLANNPDLTVGQRYRLEWNFWALRHQLTFGRMRKTGGIKLPEYLKSTNPNNPHYEPVEETYHRLRAAIRPYSQT